MTDGNLYAFRQERNRSIQAKRYHNLAIGNLEVAKSEANLAQQALLKWSVGVDDETHYWEKANEHMERAQVYYSEYQRLEAIAEKYRNARLDQLAGLPELKE